MPATDAVLEFLVRHHGASGALEVALAAADLFESFGASHVIFRAGTETLAERGVRGNGVVVEFAGTNVHAAVDVRAAENWELCLTGVTLCIDVLHRRGRLELERRKHVHDLRGALAVVAGQCEMLESGVWGNQSEEQQRSVRAMIRQIDRMRSLLEAGPVRTVI